ncbi:TM0106 family RecB-like putative nuclease [Gordonia pseudamarae]|uniref:TM0106 family RecB-like putative nuclease n=1 Tax=Gordonia pseudamarae TaxID=2831662 RepID=A0ABX6IP67_9ACTN|nr:MULTISPECIES: TM0106 family RecB-like putative nuclease [Gordonia]MBD0024294.1 TM0106 family RecB-like putative nuclease [Gordonia sp. (in: high G+C Gram-positive bacteria)]QHN28315.1 TM0106 family RecB-like putative nuclease [Gordonia pseudamarae]QHN37184.1 TM0106 family RecB-like putative nuclease [Gordonia pseudamarae]
MRTVLHARDLAGCEHRLALDSAHTEAAADVGGQTADTPSVARRKAAAADHRGRVRDMLRDLHGGDLTGAETFRVIDSDASRVERVAATRRACADEVRWIWNATLPTDRERGRRGDSELLVRVRYLDGAWVQDGPRPDPDRPGHPGEENAGYIPVIVVNHRVTYPATRNRPPGDDPADSVSGLVTSPLGRWSPGPDRTRSSRGNRRDQLRLAQLVTMLMDLGLAPTPVIAPVSVERSDDPDSTDRGTDCGGTDQGGVDPGGRGSGGSLPAGVIGLDADCIVVHDMAPVLADYAEVFARRRAVADGLVRTRAHRISECRGCIWWPHCETELVARRDVSLVVRGAQAAALAVAGIATVEQLAAYVGEPPADWAGGDFDDAVVTAAAWLADVPLIRRVRTPRIHRADVEVDVDMESFGESGAYLWGTLLTDTTDPGVPVLYRPFVTWTPLPTADEARSFAEFWIWLCEQRQQARADGKTFAAYCYSQQAENRWLLGSADRFGGMPGIPTRAEVEAFIGSQEWVDVFEAVGDNFISPGGKGLKRVAPVAGHRWRDPEAGGEASMDWYAEAVGLAGGRPDPGQRTRLLEYNEDDVVATKVLREWMTGPQVADIPHVDDLRPAGPPPDRLRPGQ